MSKKWYEAGQDQTDIEVEKFLRDKRAKDSGEQTGFAALFAFLKGRPPSNEVKRQIFPTESSTLTKLRARLDIDPDNPYLRQAVEDLARREND